MKRPSGLDVATIIVALLALVLIAQPTSAVRVSISDWRRSRAEDRLVERRWQDVAAVASPLRADLRGVDLIEVVDYECPYCRAIQPVLDSALSLRIRIAVLHLPLPTHPLAQTAALAALCAERLGRLGEVHAKLLRTEEWRSSGEVRQIVRSVFGSTSEEEVAACMDDPSTHQVLRRHRAAIDSLGVVATPTLLSPEGRVRARPVTVDALLRAAARSSEK